MRELAAFYFYSTDPKTGEDVQGEKDLDRWNNLNERFPKPSEPAAWVGESPPESETPSDTPDQPDSAT